MLKNNFPLANIVKPRHNFLISSKSKKKPPAFFHLTCLSGKPPLEYKNTPLWYCDPYLIVYFTGTHSFLQEHTLQEHIFGGAPIELYGV